MNTLVNVTHTSNQRQKMSSAAENNSSEVVAAAETVKTAGDKEEPEVRPGSPAAEAEERIKGTKRPAEVSNRLHLLFINRSWPGPPKTKPRYVVAACRLPPLRNERRPAACFLRI